MQVEVSNRQSALECETQSIRDIVGAALAEEGKDAELSVALVGDREMAALNERFLQVQSRRFKLILLMAQRLDPRR